MTAVLTLAIGIGGTTVTFSVVEAVLLRPLPFTRPEMLVGIWETKPGQSAARGGVSPPDFFDWRERSTTFDSMALFGGDQVLAVLETPSGSVQVADADVTANLFAVLGVPPLVGRGFSLEPGAPRSVVLSERLWRAAFHADPAVVGRVVRVEGGLAFPVAGVMPERAGFPAHIDLWISASDDLLRTLARDGRFFGGTVARLRKDVSVSIARTELAGIAGELAREYPTTNAGWTVAVDPLGESIVGNYRTALLMLMGAVGFVLLVGCANIASLLLARGVSKRRELAVRSALGASRARLVRHLLAESLVLAVGGGVVGWVSSLWAARLVMRAAASIVPAGTTVQLNFVAFIFCGAASIATMLLAGLLPALYASRANFQAAVQADGERASSARGEPRLQRIFVSIEIGLSLVLVTGALLLVQSFMHLRRVDIGFDPEHVVSIDARVPLFRFSPTMDIRSRFLLENEERQLLDRLRGVPGVQAVAAASEPPLGRRSVVTEVTIRPGERRVAAYHRISPGYFATLGIPFVAGRDFDDRDALRAEQFVDLRRNRRTGALVVNETAARLFSPNGAALGQHVSTGMDFAVSDRAVVGIVRDAQSQAVGTTPEPEIYVPYLEDPSFAMTFLIRTALPIAQVLPVLRAAMRSVDLEISTANERTVDEMVNGAFDSPRLNAAVVALFATVALLLSAIGIYGMLAFSVSRRTREFGIRIALGADAKDIRRLLLRETMTSIAVGILCGVAGAIAVNRWISSLLFGITPHDPLSFATSITVLLGVCFIAGYLPLRTAAGTNAAQALKLE